MIPLFLNTTGRSRDEKDLESESSDFPELITHFSLKSGLVSSLLFPHVTNTLYKDTHTGHELLIMSEHKAACYSHYEAFNDACDAFNSMIYRQLLLNTKYRRFCA